MPSHFPEPNLSLGINVAWVEFNDQLVFTLGFFCVPQATQQLSPTKTDRFVHGILLQCV